MMSIEPKTNLLVRDMLIEHMDGRAVVLRFYKKDDPSITLGQRHELAARRRMISHLIDREYLKTTICENGVGMETVITDKGRAALAVALADWADALVRVNTKKHKNPDIPLWADPPLRGWRA